jgi:hypothetical protein
MPTVAPGALDATRVAMDAFVPLVSDATDLKITVAFEKAS